MVLQYCSRARTKHDYIRKHCEIHSKCHVPSEYGIVLDIVHTDEGNEMLIDDGTGVITKVRSDTIPKEVVTAARKAKREATRRLARK